MTATTTSLAGPGQRAALPALWLGLLFTAGVGAYALLDGSTTHVLADHLRATYPAFGEQEVQAGVTTYVSILLGLTGLGTVGWLATIWAARSGKGWTVWFATALLVAAVGVAAVGLTTLDTSGEVGLAPLMGWLLMLPTVPGLVAVVLLWTRRRSASSSPR
ncbi:hypothetical protein [Occultella gossypii]|uniref:DUF2567 domain-containing protein n=1 Tax=Occultella gossypii TaxID=2800820 RepID=A0ABS7SDS5_9MICO|nr:hypothetical protein [Occultella gossypii]MBZ2198497.1 hypothetical protein [Occultella gossypii]